MTEPHWLNAKEIIAIHNEVKTLKSKTSQIGYKFTASPYQIRGSVVALRVVTHFYPNSKNGVAIFTIKNPYWAWFLIHQSVTTLW